MAGLVTTGGKVRAVFVSSSAPFIPADLVFAKPPKLQVRQGKSIMFHILNKRLKLETCTVCVFPVITYFSQAVFDFFHFHHSSCCRQNALWLLFSCQWTFFSSTNF